MHTKKSKRGFALIECLLAAIVVVVFSVGMLGFLSIHRRSENNGKVISHVNSWFRDRAITLQSGAASPPPSPSVYNIPASYVGAIPVEVRETVSTAEIPTGYPGASVVTMSATWTNAIGEMSSRSLNFIIYNPN